jgi:orotidine-5'-phosphate decarboxylase
MTQFGDRLVAAVRAKKTPAMVGIDPRADWLPRELVQRHRLSPAAAPRIWARAVEEFCSRVLDVVARWVPAVKFQSAFFELFGAAGIEVLHTMMAKGRRLGLLTILDAKRGDIGSTSQAYAQAAFGAAPAESTEVIGMGAGADGLTVNPYLGMDSLEPFLSFSQKGDHGLFVLVRTSNPGASDLQQLRAGPDARPVWSHVAAWVREWSEATKGLSGYGAVGAVVGGTAGAQIAELRAAMPTAPLLIPGYGAQGATASDIAGAFDERGLGALVNSSRAVLFPHRSDGSVEAPAHAWEAGIEHALESMIADLAAHTPAGKLRAG